MMGHEFLEVDAELLIGRTVTVAVEIELNVGQHLIGGLVTFVAVAPEGFLDDGFKPRIDVGAEIAKLRDRHRQDIATGLEPVG